MSNPIRRQYPFHEFEPAWQKRWLEDRAFRAPNPGENGFDPSRPKFYVLDMFPYPSGQGLHVGHVEGYTATDIVARYKRMRGFNVLHPMGWDAFGLPAEQYAIKTGCHPRETTERNITRFREQLQAIGFSYDWDREFSTTDPSYFQWTQWIFLRLYDSWFNPETNKAEPISTYPGDDPDAVRLAYVSEVPVNWCPELGTVLANEEVVDGRSEVGGFPVERRPMRQWMLRITAYAERLLAGLESLDWPDSIKLLQKNWIGRSEGARVVFRVADSDADIEVFTTRPDTLFGATYMVLAPEHPLVEQITTASQRAEMEKYRARAARKSDFERGELNKDKTGVFTGAFAVNPVNEEKIPVWIADYVLMGYGTGAIMAVPAHDERDFEFARRFRLEIRPVVEPKHSGGGMGFQPMRDSDQVRIREGANLPHWTQENATYAVTFRLADSLPQSALDELSEDRRYLFAKVERGEQLTELEMSEWKKVFSEKINAFLDAGFGSCALRNFKVAAAVADALKHFDGQRYELLAWCVMPNHVHVIVRPFPGHQLPAILHSWKSFTANRANEILQRTGAFWQGESYDHIIRNSKEFVEQVRYLLENPIKAGLKDWQWIGAKTTHGRDAHATDCFTGEGVAVNSGLIDGLETREAKRRITAWLEERGVGRGTVNYKLRDWLFSRQRYWGEPFPVVWEDGRHRALPEEELPVLPPELDDFRPTGTPEPPLAKSRDWVRYSEQARRETNTMPQWAGSCWYFLRFCDPLNSSAFASPEAQRYWMGEGDGGGVDLYVGGAEHAVLHLLYSRFWHMVLHDLGHVTAAEPFRKLVNQGIILGPDGQKMAKSRGNVVNPEEVILQYGADSLRLYEMFMGPLEQMKPWSMQGVEGVYRFLGRVWRLAFEEDQEGGWRISSALRDVPVEGKPRRALHETIRKVGADIESFGFNTAISQMMICGNELTSAPVRPVAALRDLLVLLSPFAPHLAEEMWMRLGSEFPGFEGHASLQSWPQYDEAVLAEEEVELAVQVNGKVRDRLTLAKDAPREAIETAAMDSGKVREHVDGKQVVKVVVVPGRLVNIVVK